MLISVTTPARRRSAVAALAWSVLALAGCDAADQPEPTPASAGRTAPPTTGPASAISHSPAPVARSNSPLPARRPATVRSVRAVPDQIDPFACTPPAPERPEVTADVWPGDHRPDELTVTLDYNGDPAGDKYRGTVRMQYNPATRLFTYRLPPASQANLPPRAANISLNVRVHPGDDAPPPPGQFIRIVGYCTVLQN